MCSGNSIKQNYGGWSHTQSREMFLQVKKIPFWGVRITENGIQPDPNEVEFVKQATAPTSKEELILFLSMIQSNSKFLPNLSSQTANLRALAQKQKIYLDSNPPDRI